MLAFPDIKMHGNGQIGKKGCRHVGALLAKLADIVMLGQNVSDMLAAYPFKESANKQEMGIFLGGDRQGVKPSVDPQRYLDGHPPADAVAPHQRHATGDAAWHNSSVSLSIEYWRWLCGGCIGSDF
jgi:hypothetical protein